MEAASIPGTRLTFRKLGFSGKPYLMERDTPTNRAVATVHARSLQPAASVVDRWVGSGHLDKDMHVQQLIPLLAWCGAPHSLPTADALLALQRVCQTL